MTDHDNMRTLRRRIVGRRALLRGIAFGGAGLVGAALIGCSDDDEEPAAAATSAPTAAPPVTTPEAPAAADRDVIIEQVTLDGSDGVIVLLNTSAEAQSLDGWVFCQRPAYWGLPPVELAPGARLTVHVGSGTDTGDDVFANGGLGTLSGASGEVALYRSRSFGSADAIVSYVNWNGGGGRRSVAVEAGIWGDENVAVGDGDTIATASVPTSASDYSVN